jgi:hypothetical protein
MGGHTKHWATWLDRHTPRPGTAEVVKICVANAEEAFEHEKDAHRRYERAAPESKELYQAQDDIQRYAAEQRHWRRYALLYRQQLAAEIIPTTVSDGIRPKRTGEIPKIIPVAAEDRATSREVGADDGDEDDAEDRKPSAYEDLGGGVRT